MSQDVRTIGSMRALDETRGAVRVEDVYDTDIEDLWDACTTPARLARWLADVEGDLRVGGTVHLTFTSSASPSAVVEVCDAPRHLLLRTSPGTSDEGETEAWLSEEGERTRLVVEQRGLLIENLPFHGAGWQAHLEDLGTSLETGATVHPDGWSAEAPSPYWHERWTALTPTYRAMDVG